MHVRTLVAALTCLLLSGSVAVAQTPAIQKKVEKKLGEMKKEKSALDDLMELALKNNPDIRLAESKQRDADAALYRTRMQILEKVTMLHYEIKASKSAADAAKARYQRDQTAYDRGARAAAELAASVAARDKFQSDYERLVARMEFLTGKHSPNANAAAREEGYFRNSVRFAAPKGSGPPPPAPSFAVPEAMAGKIRKALDSPYDSGASDITLPAFDLLKTMRQRTKGINILDKVDNVDDQATLRFKESIPLGALFQWAEDQFNWRFIIRDYGIVAVDGESVPPGAVLLLDFWRQGATEPAGP